MFIISDCNIINCDNISSITFYPANGKYQVSAYFGNVDTGSPIILVNTIEQAKECISIIAEKLHYKEPSLTVDRLIQILKIRTKSDNEVSTDELLNLFRNKNKE